MLRTWDEVLQTRLSDPKTGIFIVIMQRSHERDLIGHIVANTSYRLVYAKAESEPDARDAKCFACDSPLRP